MLFRSLASPEILFLLLFLQHYVLIVFHKHGKTIRIGVFTLRPLTSCCTGIIIKNTIFGINESIIPIVWSGIPTSRDVQRHARHAKQYIFRVIGFVFSFCSGNTGASLLAASPATTTSCFLGTVCEVPRDDSVCLQLGQSKHLLHRYFLSFASDDGMFSRQLQQKCEST